MKNFRNLATWRLIIWSVLFIATVLFSPVAGDDDDDGLEQPLEEQPSEAVTPPSADQSPADAVRHNSMLSASLLMRRAERRGHIFPLLRVTPLKSLTRSIQWIGTSDFNGRRS